MRKINRTPEPDFWIQYKKKHPAISYNELNKSEEGRKLIRDMRNYLIDMQYGLCAYCCKTITSEKSLNEHIKPQGNPRFSALSMEYDNLVANCVPVHEEATCSAKKKNKYDEALFVSPLDMNCEEHFSFAPSGEVFGLTKKGQYTIDILGLNAYHLIRARRAQIKACKDYYDERAVMEWYLTPSEGKLEQFADAIEYLYRMGYFEADD